MKPAILVCAALLMFAGAAAAAPARWEVTVAASDKRSDAGSKSSWPEAEVKYLWSDRVELGIKANWTDMRPVDGPPSSALGAGEFAYKYRFIDASAAGVDVSFAPALVTRLNRSSVRRDIASANKELLLGLETVYARDKLEVEVKSGWNFIEHEAGHAVFEVKSTYQCAARLHCVVAAERKFGPGEQQTSAKLELEVELTPSLLLKSAIGREFGVYETSQKNRVVSMALQSTF
jgi:hypothetical protein